MEASVYLKCKKHVEPQKKEDNNQKNDCYPPNL